MRILFTFAAGNGHLEPLVPIARVAKAAGHTVAFCCRPWMTAKVEALGFVAFVAGSDQGLTPVKRPLAAVDMAHEFRTLGNGFGGRKARERAAGLLPLCVDWQPDILVCEEVDFGAMVVAEKRAIPFATVLIMAVGFVRPDAVAEPLNEVRAEYDLPADSDLAMLSRYLVFTAFPPSFRDPEFPLSTTAHRVRLSTVGTPAAAPSWTPPQNDRPCVYFTLGTVFNMEAGDLFQRVIAGLSDLPINLIVTVGRDLDPSEIGPVPPNVQVHQFIPQAEILPHCQLVIAHAGSGSTLGALAHGLPLILIPMGADQPLNAARCEALGVATVFDGVTLTSEAVRAAARHMLETPSYRQNAESIRAELLAMPGPEYTLPLLEQLAAEKRLIRQA